MNKTLLFGFIFLAGLARAQNAFSPPAGVTRVEVPGLSLELLGVPYELFNTNANAVLSHFLTGSADTNLGDRVSFQTAGGGGDFQEFVKLDGTGQPTVDGRWYSSVNTNVAMDVVLFPGQGFFVQNKRIYPQSLFLSGKLPLTGKTVPLVPGFNTAAHPYPSAIRLESTSLKANGALAGADANAADVFLQWQGISYASWFQANLPGTPTLHGKWVDESASASNPWIKAGQGFRYTRRGASTLTWPPPRPYANIFSSNGQPPVILNLAVTTNGVNTLTFSAQGITNEVYQIFTRDLTPTGVPAFDGGWRVADATVNGTGTNTLAFVDDGTLTGGAPCSTNFPTRLYIVARADIDADSDRKSNALETLRDRSNPNLANADPYPTGSPIALPRRIQAENYDQPYLHPTTGVLVKPYNELTPGNQGGTLRSDDVDVYQAYPDTLDTTPYYVWIEKLDKMDFQVENTNTTAAMFDVAVRYASANASAGVVLHLDGVEVKSSQLPSSGALWNWRTFVFRNVSIGPGRHTLRVGADSVPGSSYLYSGNWSLNHLDIQYPGVIPNPPTALPYLGSAAALPGVIEAEHYDTGPMADAYLDFNQGNQGNAGFRTNESVDVYAAVSPGTTPQVLYDSYGEYTRYTVQVAASGLHDIAVRYRTVNPSATISILKGSSFLVNSANLPNGGFLSITRTKVFRNLNLVAGTQSWTVGSGGLSTSGGWYLDYIEVRPAGQIPEPVVQSPFLGAPFLLPTLIQAEDFDAGLQNEAYFDNSEGNSGTAGIRTSDHVDIQAAADVHGSPHVFLGTNEWLEWTVSSPTTKAYKLSFRYRTNNLLNRRVTWTIDGAAAGGTIVLPNTGPNFATYLIPSVTVPAGTHIVRLSGAAAGFDGVDVNYFVFADEGDTESDGITDIWEWIAILQNLTDAISSLSEFNFYDDFNGDGLNNFANYQAYFSGTTAKNAGEYIQAENYDAGGHLHAYVDTTPTGNAGGALRNDGVDIYNTPHTGDATPLVRLAAGESLNFTVNIPSNGLFDVELELGNTDPADVWSVLLDGNVAGYATNLPVAVNLDTAAYVRPVLVRDLALFAGKHILTIRNDSCAHGEANFNRFRFGPSGSIPELASHLPYGIGPAAVPGWIEAEDFDAGFMPEAYLDTTFANAGLAYRPTVHADLFATGSTNPAYLVRFDASGREALNYTVDVTTNGVFDLVLRYSASSNVVADLLLLVNGQPTHLGQVPPTSSTNEFRTYAFEQISLTNGVQEIRLENLTLSAASDAHWWIDSFEIVPHVFHSPTPLTGHPVPAFATLPGILQAEHFDEGGEGVAYHDFDPTNTLGTTRSTEGVEIADSNDPESPGLAATLAPTEWLVWSFTLAHTTAVQVTYRYQLTGTNTQYFAAGFLDSELVVPVALTPTGTNYQNTALGNPITLPPGTYHYKLASSSAEPLHLNWISISTEGDLDGDGMPDAWELTHGLNPYDPSDALMDPDGDGRNNLTEYGQGTNPLLSDDPPPEDFTFIITWPPNGQVTP